MKSKVTSNHCPKGAVDVPGKSTSRRLLAKAAEHSLKWLFSSVIHSQVLGARLCAENYSLSIFSAGTFWQVSDFHYDKNYTVDGVRSAYCHSVASEASGELGPFGDRKCDAPWLLATSAVEAMKSFKSNPDFIVWTGYQDICLLHCKCQCV